MDEFLKIDNCPHCSVNLPNMVSKLQFDSSYDNGEEPKKWGVYVCKRCGGAVLALADSINKEVVETFPKGESANLNLPTKVRAFLNDAMNCVFAPSASIMASNSAIDAMLKEKGYKEGILYDRIKKAKEENILTEDMELWAHQVRLEANDMRHADDDAEIPTMNDAKRCLEFAKTLGEILFVIPAKVTRGLNNTQEDIPKKPPRCLQEKSDFHLLIKMEDIVTKLFLTTMNISHK